MIFPPLNVQQIIVQHQQRITSSNEYMSTLVITAMKSLDSIRKSEWKFEHRRHTLTLDMNDYAHNMMTQLKAVAPRQVGVPPHGWVGRAIMAVASSSLALYPTTLREDEKIFNITIVDPNDENRRTSKWAHYQKNALKIRMGEKKILKSWLRFGYVLNYNFYNRPNRITVAITVDSRHPSVVTLHSSTLKSLDGGDGDGDGEGACWEAYTPSYPDCSGYESADYTCVGHWCAAATPEGSPNSCAENKGTGFVVDHSTGRCISSGEGEEEAEIFVGMPVFAQWGNEFYDGAIVATSSESRVKSKTSNVRKERDTYIVQFYDGDFKADAPRDSIVSFPSAFITSNAYKNAIRQSMIEVPNALSGVCFIVTSGYLTYEVCVGYHVIQYHHNSDGTRGNIITLGKYVDVSSIVLNCNAQVKDSVTYEASSASVETTKTCTESTTTYESNTKERSIHFTADPADPADSANRADSADHERGDSINAHDDHRGSKGKTESTSKTGRTTEPSTPSTSNSFDSTTSAAQGKHAYRQMFRQGEASRQVEVIFICRREKDAVLRKRAEKGDSHSMAQLAGQSKLSNNRIVRDYLHANGNSRSTGPFSVLSTGRILSIDEPELLSYRIVIGTESACVGLASAKPLLLEEIRAEDARVNDQWIQHQMGKGKRTPPDPAGTGDPLLYENMKDQVISVMTTSKGQQTWAKAFIEHVDKDKNTYSVNFDDHNMKRELVPMTEILPIPKNLLKLPCWLFEEVDGGGCD